MNNIKHDVIYGDIPNTGMGAPKPTKTELVIECEDKCSALSLVKYSDEDSVWIMIYKAMDKSFWQRLKDAWKIVIGKEHTLVDLVVEYEEFKKINKL